MPPDCSMSNIFTLFGEQNPLSAGESRLSVDLQTRLAIPAGFYFCGSFPQPSVCLIVNSVGGFERDGPDPDLRPSPDEVLAVYRIGLHALRDGEPRFVTIPESERPVVQVPLGNDLIHAPTGAVLYQLRQVGLLGRAGERVDHLEQPVFAWR